MRGFEKQISEIARLHAQMRDLTIESRVKEKRYDRSLERVGELSDAELEELHCWYEGVLRSEYRAVLEIKRLLPQAVWDRYRDMGETDLREQVLLSERQAELRRVWRARPKPRRVRSDGKQESAESEELAEAPDGGGVRPEG